MVLRREIKKNAKLLVKGSRSLHISIFILYISIMLFPSYIFTILNFFYIDKDVFFDMSLLSIPLWVSILTATITAARFLLKITLNAGVKGWYFNFVDSRCENVGGVFAFLGARLFFKNLWIYFQNFVKIIVLFILLELPTALFFIARDILLPEKLPAAYQLLIILGAAFNFIISFYFCLLYGLGFFLCPYLIKEEKGTKARKIIKKSRKYMKGHVRELLWFYITLVPAWVSLIFIIPAFWGFPYIKAAEAIYASYFYATGKETDGN